ncbi:hypothetical protein LTR85_003453 [Meristemomyces frigidus]|nr:hypothetical protein LTR85_003453 [Meristemomyces frigidus]
MAPGRTYAKVRHKVPYCLQAYEGYKESLARIFLPSSDLRTEQPLDLLFRIDPLFRLDSRLHRDNTIRMPINKAAWIPAKCAPFTVDEAPMPEPEANEVVIRVRAVAINPVDAAIQSMGIIVEDYPAVVGCDVAGDITTVGSDISDLKPGDRVLACLDLEAKRVNKGSFQLYCAALATLTAILPENVSYTQGCVLPLALSTAATSLFQKGNLEMQHPQVDPEPNGKSVLIWGGSSSVGSCAIQMAKAAGYEVATTCSSHNFDYCRSIGADHVLDHKKDDTVDRIVSWGSSLKNDEVGAAIWGSWVTPALVKGTLKCKPEPDVVGHGLEAIQEACDRMMRGVSAKKLVVEIA